jgi:hypothetical protein
MMDNDIRIVPRELSRLFTIGSRELEELEVIGSATPHTREELADLHEFLDKLYAISLEHASKTSH